LKSQGLHKILPSQDRVVVPLSFVQDVHLDTRALQERIEHLRPIFQNGRQLEPKDLYICTSPEYQALRAKMASRLDNITQDAFHTPAFELEFKNYYRYCVDLERKYGEGVCLILNNLVLSRNRSYWAYESLKWFSRFWRSELLSHLYNAQSPNDPKLSSYGADCLRDRFGSDNRSYDEPEFLASMDVGPTENNMMFQSFRVHIDRESSAYRDTQSLSIERLLSYDASIVPRYVVPQMVALMVEGVEGPYSWSFEGYGIGRA
jgi:hypothetical protein